MSLAAGLAVAAVVVPVSSAHSTGWWWTVQKANQTMLWWSATHHLDTTCRGIGPSIASPCVEYKATVPTVNGDLQAEKGQPHPSSTTRAASWASCRSASARKTSSASEQQGCSSALTSSAGGGQGRGSTYVAHTRRAESRVARLRRPRLLRLRSPPPLRHRRPRTQSGHVGCSTRLIKL
jgi:predicted dehydrogenase